MLYIGGKKLDGGKIAASYALINAETMMRDILSTILDELVDKVSVGVAKTEDSKVVNVTDNLAESDWVVYNCPAFEQDYYMYEVFGTLKDSNDFKLLISIYSEKEGVTIDIIGDDRFEEENSSVPPFFEIIDTIENLSHFKRGYRGGLEDYRKKLLRYNEALKDVLDDFEGNNLVQFGVGNLYQTLDLTSRADAATEDNGGETIDMVPSEMLSERAKQILDEEEFDERKTDNVLVSNPFIVLEDENTMIAVMFTEYSSEEARRGCIGRPSGAVIFDMKGNPVKVGFEQYLNTNSVIKSIEGNKFSTVIENADELDFSDDYYDYAYNLLDQVRVGIIAFDKFDTEKFNEYVELVMANVPESYRPFYYAMAAGGKVPTESKKAASTGRTSGRSIGDRIAKAYGGKTISETDKDKGSQPDKRKTAKKQSKTKDSGKVKIGQFVRDTMSQLIEEGKLGKGTVLELQDEQRCRELFHIGFPILKIIDPTIPIKEQTKIEGYIRYWKDVYTINGEEYIICSQWIERNREDFLKWVESL